LETVLLAKGVESIVDAVKQLNELPSRVLLDDLVEAFNVHEHDSDFTLCFREVLFAVLDAGADQTGNQNVDNRLQLLQLFYVAELGHKADFLLNFVPVGVVSPEENVEGDGEGLPDQLDRTVLGIRDVLNRGEADVQKADGWCETDQRDEEDRVQTDQVREGYCVQELDL